MSKRFTLALIETARACGVEGPRVRHTRKGPRLLGRFRGAQVNVPFPRTEGRPRPDGAACRALRARLEAERRHGKFAPRGVGQTGGANRNTRRKVGAMGDGSGW